MNTAISKMVGFGLPLDQLHALIDQGIKEPLIPMTRMFTLDPPEPGDEQKREELKDLLSPGEFEAIEAAINSMVDQCDALWIPYVVPMGQRDYTKSFPASQEGSFTFHISREAIPGIRKCLGLAVASHGPRGWMGRCMIHLEATFAALEAAGM